MIIRTLSDYCKEKFGTKVYRLSLSTGCSCPNRDGRAGRGGCSFCAEGGSGEFATKVKPIEEQIEEAKDRVKSKFPKDIKARELGMGSFGEKKKKLTLPSKTIQKGSA